MKLTSTMIAKNKDFGGGGKRSSKMEQRLKRSAQLSVQQKKMSTKTSEETKSWM